MGPADKLMKRRYAAPIAAAALILVSLGQLDAQEPVAPRSVPGSAFYPVVLPSATPTPTIAPVVDTVVGPVLPPAGGRRESTQQPTVRPRVSSKLPSSPASRTSIKGLATWYCKAGRSVCHHKYPDKRGPDLYAAAGSEIRIGDWRGRTVRVCRSDGLPVLNPKTRQFVDCLPIKLVDWCACKGNRIIDLYWDAFDAMNRRGETGGVKVTVAW